MNHKAVSKKDNKDPPDDGAECSSRYIPLFSREMSLQAHFSFGGQTAGAPQVNLRQISSGNPSSELDRNGACGPLLCSKGRHFRWRGEDGSRCSLSCNPDSLTVSYNTPHDRSPRHDMVSSRDKQISSAVGPLPVMLAQDSCNDDPSKAGDSNKPFRSLTFSGSQAKPKAAQKQYGRRCKSTAHIVLQQNESKASKQPHEFHEVPHRRNYASPKEKNNGSLRGEDAGSEDFSRGGKGATARMSRIIEEDYDDNPFCYSAAETMHCPCYHCSIYRMIRTMPACTCQSCMTDYHLHHPRHCLKYADSHYYDDRPRRSYSKPRSKSPSACQKGPTAATFNSHRCYEGDSSHRNHRQSRSRHDSPSPRPYGGESSKSKHQSDRCVPQDRRDSGGQRVPRIGVSYPSHQVFYLGSVSSELLSPVA